MLFRSYAVGLDKSVAKEILSYYHIATPHWVTIKDLKDLEQKPVDFFPILVKPIGEGSSKGINAKNLVNDFASLKNIVSELLNTFHQPVLVEEYLPGREFTVGVIGNPPRVLPIIEVTFKDLPAGMPQFDHYEAKWVYDNPDASDPLVCPADIDENLRKKIENLCLRAFDALEMADWGRIDVRLDKNGEPNFIEINCPP